MRFKIGLLGGTFNPVHRGHVELGLKVGEAFGLEKILYILSAKPPHKKGLEIMPVDIRWKMLQKALEPFPHLVPCDIEMKRSTDSWTIDTVGELTDQFPGNHYYFISGSEGFLKIRTWKNYKKLLNTLPFIVVLRKEADKPAVKKLLRDEGITGYDITPPKRNHPEKSPVYIFTYQSDCLGISSTFIRQKIKLSGYEGIENFVGKEVKKIMEENNLYEEK
ncbi:MAG: nicotinate-nicotinamide nucleotide adenylyltransferase [Candidatus Aminicenantes bacterium]|nr:MAG: nicotinate-nicotinamide nucleotide adenylyltransferase [Candidatus Aminicenantes bacterium]